MAATAVFELFARSTGAGGVAAGVLDGKAGFALGQVELELGLRFASTLDGTTNRARTRRIGLSGVELLRAVVELIEEVLEVGGGAEEVLEGFLLDGLHELDEELVVVDLAGVEILVEIAQG